MSVNKLRVPILFASTGLPLETCAHVERKPLAKIATYFLSCVYEIFMTFKLMGELEWLQGQNHGQARNPGIT